MKTFLGLDFGAGTLKMAEFEVTEAGVLVLKQFGTRPLGLEGAQDSARQNVLTKAIQELITERPVGARRANVCTPGFHVFSKFIKLPPVDSSKLTQIVQYEAQQNVPFPLEEVVWDYQVTGTTASGELEVFLAAIKAEYVESMFKSADAAGIKLELVDVSAAALCNAFRYNYSDFDGCSMLIDVGAKTSNVLFFEKNKFFGRSINIGANSITQEFAAEARMRFAEAEKFKISEGFVSLGGAYEEPENPKQAQLSKIARQVLTRLHIQINQTIQIYRSQQGGSAPQRVFLAGGASIMPYTDQFFSEKIGLPVEYFNPLRNVQIDPSINLEELAKVAHMMGEVVGLGLRNMAECPIELNLMPRSIRKKQELAQKKPYFIATAASLVLGLFVIGWFYDQKVVGTKLAQVESVDRKIMTLKPEADKLKSELDKANELKAKADQVSLWAKERVLWPQMLTDIRNSLIEVEQEIQQKYRLPVGVWIERFNPELPEPMLPDTIQSPVAARRNVYIDPALAKRYGPAFVRSMLGMSAEQSSSEESKPKSTNEITVIKITCAAVNLKKFSPTINLDIAYLLENKLKSLTNYFNPVETRLDSDFTQADESDPRQMFNLTLTLKEPIKLN